MRVWSVFRKAMREQRRDFVTLVLALLTAPFFVFLYWLMVGGASTTYTVLVIDESRGGGEPVVAALRAMTYAGGEPILKIVPASDRAGADTQLKDRDADALAIIPAGFAESVAAVRSGQAERVRPIRFVGDLTNPRYSIAAVMAMTAADGYVAEATGRLSPFQLTEEPLGLSGARSEFEMYVPGLLILAVEMIIFKLSMLIAAEREAGTLRRLQLTRMTALDYLAGVSLSQLLVAGLSVALTFGIAIALGFHSKGSLWLGLLVAVLAAFAMIGFGLIVAAFARNATQASVLATFPLFLLMFFTGAAFPLPKLALFTIGPWTVHFQDLLPPTHGVNALNKVLTFGADLGEISGDLAVLFGLSALVFAIGVGLFRRSSL